MRSTILVIALNPSIDVEWTVPSVRWEEKNTILSERRWAGGKGVNVARWLAQELRLRAIASRQADLLSRPNDDESYQCSSGKWEVRSERPPGQKTSCAAPRTNHCIYRTRPGGGQQPGRRERHDGRVPRAQDQRWSARDRPGCALN